MKAEFKMIESTIAVLVVEEPCSSQVRYIIIVDQYHSRV